MKSLKILLLFLVSTIFLCNCKDEKEEENELFSIVRKWYWIDDTSGIISIWDFSEDSFTYYQYDKSLSTLTIRNGNYIFDGSHLSTTNIVSRTIENNVYTSLDSISTKQYNANYVGDPQTVPDLIIGSYLYKADIDFNPYPYEKSISDMIENANKDESYIRTMEVNAGDTVRVIISKYKADGLKKQWYDMPINSVSIKENNQTVELQIFNSLVSLTNNTPCLVYKKNRYGKESYETISLTEASSLSDDNSLFSYEIILYLDVDAKEKFTISSPERYFTWLKKEDVIIHFVKL